MLRRSACSSHERAPCSSHVCGVSATSWLPEPSRLPPAPTTNVLAPLVVPPSVVAVAVIGTSVFS